MKKYFQNRCFSTMEVARSPLASTTTTTAKIGEDGSSIVSMSSSNGSTVVVVGGGAGAGASRRNSTASVNSSNSSSCPPEMSSSTMSTPPPPPRPRPAPPPPPPHRSSGPNRLDTNGYVGIDTLQEQIRRRVMKRGFEFNLIVVGRSGLGKSTLVNTLFKSNVRNRNGLNGPLNLQRTTSTDGAPPNKRAATPEIRTTTHIIEEKGVQLRLTITDTPGFGDQIDNSNCWLPVLDYVNDQYEKYLNEEQSIDRKKHIPDTRVHCCLYFIEPTGHSLKPLDIECMRRLDKWVNIVPIIAKADTLTVEERVSFKKRIQDDLLNNGIRVYPTKESDENPEDAAYNSKMREMIPFAVVGSETQHPSSNGRTVLGRKTQWGLVEVENRLHCEFADLRDMLIRTHMQDLVEVTSRFHYENFRHDRLQSNVFNGHAINIANMNESNI